MELQDFIAGTLSQIIVGITDARTKLGPLADHISPEVTSHHGVVHSQGKLMADGSLVHFVDFDVAVVVTNSATSSKGATIGVVSEGTRESASSSTGESRIKFSVPITLPLTRG